MVISLSLAVAGGAALAHRSSTPKGVSITRVFGQDRARLAAAGARRRRWLASGPARRQRARSRTEFRRLSARAALALAKRDFPGNVVNRPWHGLTMRRGERILRYVGSHAALVTSPGGHRGLVQSNLPLLGRTASGARAPVNAALVAHGSRVQPISSPTGLQIPDNSTGDLTLDSTGVSVGLQGAASRPGQLVDGRSFMSDVYTDTDTFWQALPSGAEVSYQLRSPASPRDLGLRFSAQPGDTLSVVGAQDHPGGMLPGSVQLTRAGKTLLWIAPATAIDAQGQALVTSYTVVGNVVHLHVAARGPVAWPVMVDPGIYQVYGGTHTNPIPSWKWSGDLNTWGVSEANNNALYLFGNTRQGGGVGTYTNGSYEYFYRAAENANVYIYENDQFNVSLADYPDYYDPAYTQAQGGLSTNPGGVPSLEPGFYAMGANGQLGSWSPGPYNAAFAFYPTGSNTIGHSFNSYAASFCLTVNCSSYQPGTPGGNMAFWMLAATSGYNPGYQSAQPVAGMGDEAVYESQTLPPDAPTVSQSPPTGWVQSYAPSGLTVTGSDAGLGMGTDRLNGPGITSDSGNGCGNGTCSATSPATGAYGNIAPSFTSPAWSFTAPEGINTYTTTATDIIGNQTSTPYQVKVDRTPPVVTVSGPAYDARTSQIASGTLSLNVAATDSSSDHTTSGVASIQTFLDGQPAPGAADATQPCLQGACSLSAGGQVDFDSLTPGAHTLEVRVIDAAGNASEVDWAVVTGSGDNGVTRTIADCWTGGTPTTMAFPAIYDLGSVFDSMSLTDVSLGCNPDPSAVASANSDDVPNTVPFLNMSFGSCTPPVDQLGQQDAGCAAPLDIQLWPECARNEGSYSVPTGTDGSDGLMANADVALDQLTSSLLPQVQTAVSQEAWVVPSSISAALSLQLSALPAASYEQGTRLEIYAGNTTIVIFADDPQVANLAAAAISLKVMAAGGTELSAGALASNALGGGCYS